MTDFPPPDERIQYVMDRSPPILLAAFTGGQHDPSARLRVRQYAHDLELQSISLTEYYPRAGGAHPPSGGLSRIPWLIHQLHQREVQTRRTEPYDVAIIQRQLIATINTFEYRIRHPRLLDVDDAIWLTSRFRSVDRLAQGCEAVMCGNDYLANYFAKLNRNICIVPTSVDVQSWVPRDLSQPLPTGKTIGWIGTRGNHQYLYNIEPALRVVLRDNKNVNILIVSDAPPIFKTIPESRIVFRKWSAQCEVHDVQDMSIGVMPLPDTDWARGKCSCKLLQYLSCGIPAIASPVGMNVGVATQTGAILASTMDDWIGAMQFLLDSDSDRCRLGGRGRDVVCKSYSTEEVSKQIAKVIREVIHR